MEIDQQETGIDYTASWIESNGNANIALYVWITNLNPAYDGIAFRGGACNGRKRTSLTYGPSQGVVETAEVSNEEKNT